MSSPVIRFAVCSSCIVILTDRIVGLDQILIQLREVVLQWRELAEAVGVDNVDEILDYVSM